MTAAKKKETINLSTQKSQQELLIEKIEHLLERTDTELWKKGGRPLNQNDRFKKPQNTWERVYTIAIPSGVLVCRNSLPVKSDFLGRGFMLIPLGAPEFTIELRPEGWHHSELTDPYKRSRLSNRSCRTLCEGNIARKIYKQVEETFSAFHQARQDEFDKEVYEFVSMLPRKLREETTNLWERVEENAGDVHFITEINGMTIDVARNYVNDMENYGLIVSKHNIESKLNDRQLIKELFEAVEQLGTTSRLHTLSQALEEL